jgi:hypothetical protein
MQEGSMKCEKCGAKVIGSDEVAIYSEGHGPQPAEVCVVCGKVLCRDCSGGRLDSDTLVVPDYLCPEHYKVVREYIDGLKPKFDIRRTETTDYAINGVGAFYATSTANPLIAAIFTPVCMKSVRALY